eukprot:2601253-Pleurochrysis_carterae.AAC.1
MSSIDASAIRYKVNIYTVLMVLLPHEGNYHTIHSCAYQTFFSDTKLGPRACTTIFIPIARHKISKVVRRYKHAPPKLPAAHRPFLSVTLPAPQEPNKCKSLQRLVGLSASF